jgi:hypothetical protein
MSPVTTLVDKSARQLDWRSLSSMTPLDVRRHRRRWGKPPSSTGRAPANREDFDVYRYA